MNFVSPFEPERGVQSVHFMYMFTNYMQYSTLIQYVP